MTPRTHEQQRQAHLARQARSDALKALRAGEEAWLTVPDFDAKGVLVRVRVGPSDNEGFYPGKQGLFVHEGELQVALLAHKDGLRVFNGGRRLQFEDVFGVVLESHSR